MVFVETEDFPSPIKYVRKLFKTQNFASLQETSPKKLSIYQINTAFFIYLPLLLTRIN